MLKAKISPSMMCADFLNLERQLKELRTAGVEYLHIDIMDGHFVPNLMMFDGLLRAIRSATDIPFDWHFMVERPENMLGWFDIRAGDIVSVHVESTPHLFKAIQLIRERGALVFVALNPATPVCALSAVEDELDGVLVMTVKPGFAGQKLVEASLKKLTALRDLFDRKGRGQVILEADGNVSLENAVKMRRCGADMFVAGTSSIFRKDVGIAEGVASLRDAILKGEA